ncbi:hypothetical protein LUZ61_013028 [Rhynchospora tenuis]|uniref:Protein kinase domain-containing protein n=1 Tax=Rhynchospora tenuis TaxID=198213 RepID=A0AAD6A457_9POAL|nr:hypothetical protein LUZ61_013028 [Rhynchospora tenuis]
MKPKTISQTIPASAELSMLTIMPFLVLVVAASGSGIALPGCPETCGDIQITYPFGIGPDCSLPGFELSCKKSANGSPTPFLLNDIPVLEISLSWAQVRVNKSVTSSCYSPQTGSMISNTTNSWNLSGTPYWISQVQNTFTVIGCDIIANVSYGNETNMFQGGCVTTGCYSANSIINGFCSGLGCCQTNIPLEINSYQVTLLPWDYNSSTQNKSRQCGYAVLADSFETSYNEIINDKLYMQQQMPVVLDWSIGDESCDTAQANKSSYACISDNIAEYYSCPAFTRLKQNTDRECQIYVPYVIGMVIGLGFGTGLCAFLLYFAIRKRIELFEKRKQQKLKEKFFNQNRGFLLQQQLASNEDATQRMRIFTLDELEKATNEFDNALILGQGGHGEVYKGILSDQRVVAIKRSKIVDQAEIDQFINEVVILSQVNHRNVVKLYGCCLETEVPLLVYEFISNGTLFNHLHAEPCSLTWDHRLRIALESARAIAYLHSSASISVFHRDIKSSNILLDDYFTSKVSDFGASRTVQLDQTGITTGIQGTFGYLDPEYYYTGRLTPKSDVYSFGVILAELLTREKPNSVLFEGGGIVPYFISAMRENRLFEILDPQIAGDKGQRTELEAVANIAEMCVRLKGEERPTMKEVEVQLEILWRSNHHIENSFTSQKLEKKQPLPYDFTAENDTTRQYSLEQQLLLSSNSPR